MTFLSLIRFSARKVQSIPCFPNAPKNMAATLPLQISLRPLSSCTTRCLSVNHCLQMLLARTTTCPAPRSTALGHRTQPRIHSSIHRSQHALFNTTGHQKKFCEGRCSPKHTAYLYKSKTNWLAANFHAAAPKRTLPKSLCRSFRQASCFRLRAWIDLNSLEKLNLQHSNSALLHSEAQNTPQFIEGCC